MTDLINTLESASEFDALAKLRPGEDYFLLLARDRIAPGLVDQWAKENRKRALDEFDAGTINEEKRDRELRKSTQAEAIGWAMKAFKAGDMAKKVAEQPTVKTYSGFELDEDTKRSDRLFTLRNAAKTALNNAVAECDELLGFMAEFGDIPDELIPVVEALGSTIRGMKKTSDLVAPTRPFGRAA